jgi:hypothetical protein
MTTGHRFEHNGALQTLLGMLLIGAGGLVLLGQLFALPLEQYLWPLYIIVPGVAVLVLGLTTSWEGGVALTMTGSIIVAVGLVLFVQNVTELWATWAYAWALIGPTSAGVGMLTYGALHEQPKLVREGKDLAQVGLVLFFVGLIFFELIIGVSGFGLGGYALPLLLIGGGTILLFYRILTQRPVE